jgi:hypothetical protein
LIEQQKSYEKANRLWDQWEHGDQSELPANWYAEEKKPLEKPLDARRAEPVRVQGENSSRKDDVLHPKKGVSEYIVASFDLARFLADIPALEKQRKAFLDKTERLHTRQFTLALCRRIQFRQIVFCKCALRAESAAVISDADNGND